MKKLSLFSAILLLNISGMYAEQYRIKNTTIEIQFGDITKQDVQAVVNAAKAELTGGGGVDGAMHKAAGKQLVQYIVSTIPADNNDVRCPIGQVKITPGFNLKAPYIIHAVGPRGTNTNRKKLLASVYKNILHAKNPTTNTVFASLAIPLISTGIYGYPRREAADIVMQEIISHSQENTVRRCVRFVFFDDENGRESYSLYKQSLESI